MDKRKEMNEEIRDFIKLKEKLKGERRDEKIRKVRRMRKKR